MKLVPHRTGFSLVEVVAAAAISATLMTLTVQYLQTTEALRDKLERRTAALQEIDNLMEVLFSWDYEALTDEGIARLDAHRSADRRLKGMRLNVTLDAIELPIDAKQITIQLSDPNARSRATAPVRLTAWRYAPHEVTTP